MDIRITPQKLHGHVDIPSSKSYSHRAVIAAALAEGTSVITGVSASADIDVTCRAMSALGADICGENGTYTIKGAGRPEGGIIDCGESGSTLRFLIPIAAALGADVTFEGHGKLPTRPITPYIRELGKKGIRFDKEGGLPISMSGRLQPGEFLLEGDISSQFITGLLFALPLLEGDSVIRLTSPLESKPYADMTVSTLGHFGITVKESCSNGLPVYEIKGGQHYKPCDMRVEGDYSQAAFFYVANALGCDIDMGNLAEDTVQGDRIIEQLARVENGRIPSFVQDASDVPDLVPVLTVLASAAEGTSKIINASRLRIKESDRLESAAAMINALGGCVTVGEDNLVIEHCARFKGGTIDSYNDHRIVMSAAIAAAMSDAPVTILGAEAVNKSYPRFFDDYRSLGGIAEII